MAAAALVYDRQPKPHGVTGRQKEAWPPLPPRPGQHGSIAQYKIDAVRDWMHQHRNIRRPPDIAAPLLALICWLYDREEGYPLPTRERLAVWVTGNDERAANGRMKAAGSIDAALTTALGMDEIREEVRTVQGRVEGRASARRLRYIIPSDDLWGAYQAPRSHNRIVSTGT